MSETRKNHLLIDGGQVKEDDHVVASYKPISETDTEPRPKSALSKSKEKLADEAEEKLLKKEDEAKIVTRVDMADAKFVVGDHRNGDAKIELDANKRHFSGLTKEELLKYADDPFWVRLRWIMFASFWLLWLCMLGGAIAIIVRAPKCAPPTPKAWYEIGPLADYSSSDYAAIEAALPDLERAKVQAIFINPCQNTYDILVSSACLDQFKDMLKKAQEKSVKLIVDLTANYVPITHTWFKASENRSEEYDDYFTWSKGKDFDANGKPNLPNNWISVTNEPAWSWSATRQEYYLHQYQPAYADLNFHNAKVVKQFDEVITAYVRAGAHGVRLQKARQLLVNTSLPDEAIATSKEAQGASLNEYGFLRHSATSDQPALHDLFAHWAQLTTGGQDDKLFTIYEDGTLTPEWYLLGNKSHVLHPPTAASIAVTGNMSAVAKQINAAVAKWPLIQLTSSDRDSAPELESLSMLLPGAPLLAVQRPTQGNDTSQMESLGVLSNLRSDAAIQHGSYLVQGLNTDINTQMLAVARWKPGHSGYVALYNPSQTARVNLTVLASVPDTLTVHYVSPRVKQLANYTNNQALSADSVSVPTKSTVVLSYVPRTTVEQ